MTEPFIFYPFAIATQPDDQFVINLDQIKEHEFAMVQGYAGVEMLRRAYPDLNILTIDTAREGLKLVETGQVYGYIDTVPTINYQMLRHGISHLKISGVLEQQYAMSVGIGRHALMLQSIYDKAIGNTTETERQQILKNWLSVTLQSPISKTLIVEIIIVIGAGNIWRGTENAESGIDRVPSDYIGMMGTIMNAVALQAGLEKQGIETRVMSALHIPAVAEPYIRRRAVRHLEKKRIIICAAGTGNPYFTTDSAAGLRALELKCDVLLKGTNTDGVYDADPKTNPDATRYDQVTFDEVLDKNLRVMDMTAIAQCRDNDMPIVIFKLLEKGNVKKVVEGDDIGTRIIL